MNKALAESSQDFTADQLSLIKSTIAKGATNDELKLFLHRCREMGLDPLKPGQIYFVKYGTSPGTIVVGLDGFRSRAASTGKHSGTKRGVIRDDKGACIGGWAEVYRSDWQHPAREEVALSEYNTGKAMWAKMPETMIKKVAEVSALRMAFPDELGGMYSQDEMAQAETKEAIQTPQVQDPADYVIPFGKYKGLSLKSMNVNDLGNYVDYINGKAAEDGKPITGQVAEFMDTAIQYLSSIDNLPPPKMDDLKEQVIS